MAVSATATASPTDGAVQSCKKQKEDDISIKAITSYFSPLEKNTDRILSPPRSANIMDYFKKTPPINENTASPVLESESKSLDNSSKSLSRLKSRGKRCNLNNKLKEEQTLEHDPLLEWSNNNDDKEMFLLQEENYKASCTVHNNAAWNSITNMEETLHVCSKSSLNIVSNKIEEKRIKVEESVKKGNTKRLKKTTLKNEMDLFENSNSEIQTKDPCKETDKQLGLSSESENRSLVLILDPVTNTPKSPQLNDSTVTVSFEDFLKSQEENFEQIPRTQTSDHAVVPNKTNICQSTQHLQLKKMTVLAQIHSVPAKSPHSQKIASIFLKQKSKKAKEQRSPATSEMECVRQFKQKQKSNVVIAEEELELAILESAGSETVKSKCTAEERHQFMKAFRQPGVDTVKNGAKKGLVKQKEVGEKSSNHKLEMGEYENPNKKPASTDYANSTAHSNTDKSDSTKVKTKLKRRKKTTQAKEKNVNINDNQSNNASGQINAATSNVTQREFSQKNKGLRRRKCQSTPEKAMMSQAIIESTSDAVPLQTSTPKTNRSFKNDLYTAEITESSDSNSPIRMKFTRINISEKCMQQNFKMKSISRNIFKAKKLVEKAKAVQHNRISRTVEERLHTPLRRSSRQLALAEKKSSEEMENSVILDSSTSIASSVFDNTETPKKLQSFNEVLGKKTGIVKATMTSKGKEKMSSLIRKKVQKSTDEAIIVSSTSSEDESEDSQDATEFKARRDFLMSGLPESLKRQIAKKAATLEAYFATSSYFPKVIHIQQKDDKCLMWRLAPPSCPLLTKLTEVNSKITDVAKLTLSLGELSVLNTQMYKNDSTVAVMSGWRPTFSKTQRNVLLEEIQSSNIQFPVKQFFDLLVKKQAAPQNKQVSKCEAVNSETNTMDIQKEGKRKRKTEDRKCKRKKQMNKTENELSNKTSQVSYAKRTGAENIHTEDSENVEESGMIKREDTEFGSAISSISDFASEDMLWTEKYQPQNSCELMGNTEAVKKLHRWLSEWKRRADWEESKTLKEKKNDNEKDSLESLDFMEDKSDSDEENMLCNTMLLTGPPGIGKTAAVYACAQELGFKIFEVNASCQRSGRQILSQLREATQSHQVAKQGAQGHKPCFFNNYCGTKSPKKQSPRKEKLPVSPRRAGLKQGLTSKTLANYFKISSKLKNTEEKAQGSNKENKKSLIGAKQQVKSVKRTTKEEESNKKCATSLILFEEVDIIFDEDIGFLNAIKTFMSTTKRPVILTTNDPLFSEIFDGCFQKIIFSTPSLINVASYLQVLCLAENIRTDVTDLVALLTVNKCDIRQSILQLEFWVQSGGGYLKEKGKSIEINGTEQKINIKESTTSKSRKSAALENIPKCSTGCIENLLGLKSIFLPSEDLFSFLKHEIRIKEDWRKLTDLLTEFQMRNTDFIYSNLEIILSLPLNILPEATKITSPPCNFTAEKSSNSVCTDTDYLEEAPPVKKAKRSKRQKKIAVLDDSDLFEHELNYSGFVTLPPDISNSCIEKKTTLESVTASSVALENEASAKAKGSVHVFQCLNSLTEFLDNMSFLDCCFIKPTQSCRYEEYIWTKGKIKNGLSDEFSVEYTDWWSSQSSSELKATMEALNFNKCSKNISQNMQSCLNCSKTLGKNEFEELTLHVSKEQINLYFGQSAASSSIYFNAQKRLEIIKTVFSSSPLSLLSSQASIMEYLPVLRNICKLEKQKEQGKTKRRFLHYLEGVHLPKEILNNLATGFP